MLRGKKSCCQVIKSRTSCWGHGLDQQDRLSSGLAKCWTSQELAPSLSVILKPVSSSRSTFSRFCGLLPFFFSVVSLLPDGFFHPTLLSIPFSLGNMQVPPSLPVPPMPPSLLITSHLKTPRMGVFTHSQQAERKNLTH